MRRRLLACWLAGALACTPLAHAARNHPGARARDAAPIALPPGVRVPAWRELSPAQRRDLARLADRWDRMPAWRRVQVLERWQRWQSVPPAERETLRRGEANFRSMSPQMRARMRESLAAVARLPEPEQRRLRRLWRDLSPEGRREWLERGGPGLSPPP